MHTKGKGPKISVSFALRPVLKRLTQDVAFAENLIIKAHPSKSGGDWWYGTLLRDGKTGFFPKTYVDKIESGV